MKPHKVFLADDHPLILRGLADLIAMETDFSIVGTTTEGRNAFAMIDRLAPDIAVLDLHMPDISGLAILRRIADSMMPVRTVFLTATITPTQISEALAHGIWGIVLKETAPDTLVDCLRSVAGGQPWLAHELAAKADPLWHGRLAPPPRLTPREQEIAELACQGLSNKLIAHRLAASEGTIKIHLHNIFQKLGVTNRTALAALYFGSDARSPVPLKG
ncbi:MAG TPA: response regulator transcription factor [Sphingobium sp.]